MPENTIAVDCCRCRVADNGVFEMASSNSLNSVRLYENDRKIPPKVSEFNRSKFPRSFDGILSAYLLELQQSHSPEIFSKNQLNHGKAQKRSITLLLPFFQREKKIFRFALLFVNGIEHEKVDIFNGGNLPHGTQTPTIKVT